MTIFKILNHSRAQSQLAAGQQAKELQDSLVRSQEETLHLIRLDVSRTFPQLGIFQVIQPACHSQLGYFYIKKNY